MAVTVIEICMDVWKTATVYQSKVHIFGKQDYVSEKDQQLVLNGCCQPSKPAVTFGSMCVTYFWLSRGNIHPQTQEVFCVHQHMHINCIKL